jgi:hypothetical protein
MTRLGPALALALAVGLSGTAAAQDGRLVDVSSGPVSFTVTDDDVGAASACPGCTYVAPDLGSAIVFDVLRQSPSRTYTIDALHTGWTPAGALRLEARYTVTNRTGSNVFLATPWLPIGEAPTLVFDQAVVGRESRVRVTVAYRMVLFGDEPAGEFTTRVVHRVRENGRAITHDVRATLPTFLTLRLVGMTASATKFALTFDYGDDPGAYLSSIATGVPLRATASDLARAEVSTNHPRGYTVVLVVEEVSAPGGGADVRSRVLLQGARADGQAFSSAGPTDGFVTLFAATDYELHVTGEEPPGAYLFTLRLEAVRNP